jgi:THAP4-like, heme-binding beta-barrel domain
VEGPALHPDVAPLSFLLGSWMGEGKGFYSTIEPFEYGEEIRVWHVGKPVLPYAQRTWSLEDGRPLHAETGFWRMGGEDRVELVVAHPNGHAEVAEGTLHGTRRRHRTRGQREWRRVDLRAADGGDGQTS